jgi:hypothetical protein
MLFSNANLRIHDFSVEEKIRTPKIKQESIIDQELKKYALQIYRDLSSSSRNVSAHHQ